MRVARNKLTNLYFLCIIKTRFVVNESKNITRLI
jgi:hypothetical protein